MLNHPPSIVRHLYFPCIRMGMNKNLAMIVVFFYSACMHEYVISIPFHMIRPWAFSGMMAQIPLVAITKYIDKLKPGSSIGNMIFWLAFCIGKYMLLFYQMKGTAFISYFVYLHIIRCLYFKFPVGQPMAMLMYTIDLFHMKEATAAVAGTCTGFSCGEL